MALKTIKPGSPAAKPAKKDTMPREQVRGNIVQQYNKANKTYKQAEAEKERLEKELKGLAVPAILKINVGSPLNPIDSVRLEDTTGSTARVSFTSRYSLADGDAADAIFTQMGADINAFAQETLKPSFDMKAFNDADGNFDETRFEQFNAAVAAVAAKLGIANPLTTKKVVLPKDTFHVARWAEFPTVAEQEKLSIALPNAVQLVAGELVETEAKAEPVLANVTAATAK
jgi:hypothetical protein